MLLELKLFELSDDNYISYKIDLASIYSKDDFDFSIRIKTIFSTYKDVWIFDNLAIITVASQLGNLQSSFSFEFEEENYDLNKIEFPEQIRFRLS
jgi:hypothetical protein